MLEYIPLNFALMKNPLNWLTLILMVTIGAFAVDALMRLTLSQTIDWGNP
jgi:hypothetical protein